MAVRSIVMNPVDLIAAKELAGSTSNILNSDRDFGNIVDAAGEAVRQEFVSE